MNRSTLVAMSSLSHLPQGSGTLWEITRQQRCINRPPLEKVLAGEPVSRTIVIAYREYGYKLKKIAGCLGVHYSTASHRLWRQ